MTWPEIRQENDGWSMVFKTSDPTPEHARLRRERVFQPGTRDRQWVWAVHVGKGGIITVTYCDHNPLGG